MTTDGKEAVNKPGGLDMKSVAAWDASNLVVNAKLQFQGSDVAIKTSWSLSDDGKTLTENAHLESPMGETDQKMVFEKQEGGATVVAAAKPSAPAPSAGGAKPNYSGTWKLNAAKSDFGPIPGPDSRTDVIEHNDPALKVSTSQDGRPRQAGVYPQHDHRRKGSYQHAGWLGSQEHRWMGGQQSGYERQAEGSGQ